MERESRNSRKGCLDYSHPWESYDDVSVNSSELDEEGDYRPNDVSVNAPIISEN